MLGLDYMFLVKDLAEDILGTQIRLEAMLDSKKVCNVVAKDGK